MVAIQQVKAKYPDFKFMAEVYFQEDVDMLQLGFDFVYDKEGLYDGLVQKSAAYVNQYIATKTPYLAKGSHFVENHDEDRAALHFGSNAKANAAALASFTLPGMRFSFEGQWLGRRNKLEIHLLRSYQEAVDRDYQTEVFYSKLLPLLNDDIWHNGEWQLLDAASDSLLAWRWDLGTQVALVVVNYSGADVTSTVSLKAPSKVITMTEKFSGLQVEYDGSKINAEGLKVTVSQWVSQIM